MEQRPLYGEAFNFSYGDQLEVIDIVRRIIQIYGTEVDPVVANDVQAEIRHMCLSSAKAAALLGWKPHIGFDDGLRTTVEWYRHYLTRAEPQVYAEFA